MITADSNIDNLLQHIEKLLPKDMQEEDIKNNLCSSSEEHVGDVLQYEEEPSKQPSIQESVIEQVERDSVSIDPLVVSYNEDKVKLNMKSKETQDQQSMITADSNIDNLLQHIEKLLPKDMQEEDIKQQHGDVQEVDKEVHRQQQSIGMFVDHNILELSSEVMSEDNIDLVENSPSTASVTRCHLKSTHESDVLIYQDNRGDEDLCKHAASTDFSLKTKKTKNESKQNEYNEKEEENNQAVNENVSEISSFSSFGTQDEIIAHDKDKNCFEMTRVVLPDVADKGILKEGNGQQKQQPSMYSRRSPTIDLLLKKNKKGEKSIQQQINFLLQRRHVQKSDKGMFSPDSLFDDVSVEKAVQDIENCLLLHL